MKEFRVIEDSTVIAETTSVFGLKLLPGAALLPPEGKLLTMTVNGVQVNPVPGTYEGDIVLTVTDPIHVGTMAESDLRAAVCIENGAVVPEKSVSAAAPSAAVSGNTITGLKVTSLGDCFSALYLKDDRPYVLEAPEIECIGSGENESVGEGAGIITAGTADVTLNRARIKVRGAARSALFGGGHSKLTINDSEIETAGGVLPPDYEDSIAAGRMKRVPWMLGLRGNSRATNLAESSEAVYNRCRITAYEWGAMSTDGVDRCRLTLNDSQIRVTGPSGYGTFALLDTVNTLNHCTVDVPDYACIVANGPASTVITGGTEIHAGRFAAMCFRNSGHIRVDGGSVLKTGETTFVVKGCATRFDVEQSVLSPENGVILQVMDTDDPRNPRKYFVDNLEPDIPNPARNLTAAAPGRDVIARFRDMPLTGSIYNATTNRTYDTGPDLGDPHGPPPGGPGAPPPKKPDEVPEEQAKNLQVELDHVTLTGDISASQARHLVPKISKENCEDLGRVENTPAPAVNNGVIVTLKNQSCWIVTKPCYLTALTVDETSRIEGIFLKNGQETPLQPGHTYCGSLMLKPQP